MSEYTAQIRWQRGRDEVFVDNKYSREHEWEFDGGCIVPASPSPHIVPIPYSNPAYVDPEEAFVAALSSCHMLFFLALAAKKKILIDQYVDNAVGYMEENAKGKMMMTRVELRPDVVFGDGESPARKTLERLHHLAHEECFIANSVLTEVTTVLS